MEPIDRDRLRLVMDSLVRALTEAVEPKIAAALLPQIPPTLRPLVARMVGQLQTRSLISEAATRLVDELTDEEWRALLRLGASEAYRIVDPEDAVTPILTPTHREAMAHARRVLGV